jgi:hypothetical protein
MVSGTAAELLRHDVLERAFGIAVELDSRIAS